VNDAEKRGYTSLWLRQVDKQYKMFIEDQKYTNVSPMKEKYFGYMLLVPALLLVVTMTLFPFGYNIFLTFCRLDLLQSKVPTFIGLGNYLEVLKDGHVTNSLRITIVFVAAVVSIESIFGLGLAFLFDRKIRGLGVIRSILIIPMVMTPVVVAIMWRLMYNREYGIINQLLLMMGLIKSPLTWLGEPLLAMISIIITDVWQWTPFMFLILFAGLRSLPKSPFEAAKIDGASTFRIFRHITIPLLKPVICIAILLRMLDAAKVFDTVFTITRGGPARTTDVFTVFAFREAFWFWRMGYTATISLILFIACLVVTTIFLKLTKFKFGR